LFSFHPLLPRNQTALKEENTKLTAELREAREKIRNLELQVESLRANARKAAALLDS
jgi:coronin-1B/1C/6